MAGFCVLYDACVLYPAPLRDLLMQLALSGLYQAKWTDRIHEEWIINVLKSRPDLKREQLRSIRDLMNKHAEDSLVTGYESVIPLLRLPDENDRHVLAAAITASASSIVTFNLKDFPAFILEQYGMEAIHPDKFISELIYIDPAAVCIAVKTCRKRLKKPPFDINRYLSNLERQSLPVSVSKLREFAALL